MNDTVFGDVQGMPPHDLSLITYRQFQIIF